MSSAAGDASSSRKKNYSRFWRHDTIDSGRRKELEKRNATKYHYLKFIERQKVERKLKSCKRALLAAQEAGDENEVEVQRKQLRTHLADHEYVEHYPKHLPYNALFPATDNEASKKRREEIRKWIREHHGAGGGADADVGGKQQMTPLADTDRTLEKGKTDSKARSKRKNLKARMKRKEAAKKDGGGQADNSEADEEIVKVKKSKKKDGETVQEAIAAGEEGSLKQKSKRKAEVAVENDEAEASKSAKKKKKKALSE